MPTLEQNIRLYPWFCAFSNGHAWVTVFFLYMSQHVPLYQVLQLSAVYYFAVFVLEVPSGYFSDRIGRRTTLLISAACFLLSYCCFLIGGNFWWFATAQFLLAAGMANQSGTDTAFHYDSLRQMGRESEYGEREASAEQWGSIAIAVATLAGGFLGLIDLRLAYVYALLSALTMFVIAWRFVEPGHGGDSPSYTGFFSVVWSCLLRLRQPLLGWIFCFVVMLYAMAHIVYEFYQPYILLLEMPLFSAADNAPLISGIVISISMFGGALGARVSMPWQQRLGLIGLLALAMFIQVGILAAMAVMLAPVVLTLICARNFPMSMVLAPVRAAIAPRISRYQRATYLSLQGLSERLFFGLLLLLLSVGLEPGAPIDEATLTGILNTSLWIGLVSVIILFALFRPALRDLRSGTR